MSRLLLIVALVGLTTAACGSSAVPAAPAPPRVVDTPTALPPSPVARLTVFVDYGTVAMSDVQQVMLDARESTGEQLQYRIEYGDGAADARAVKPALAKPNQFFHSYSAPGGAPRSFVATLTVTDAFGRSSSADATVRVRDITGV